MTTPIKSPPGNGTAIGSSAADANPTGCTSGDPIDCASGDFWQTFTDVNVAGRGPGLDLTRTYNDQTAAPNDPTVAPAKGIFGYGWSPPMTST